MLLPPTVLGHMHAWVAATVAKRPLGSDLRYILSMTNPEWITGAPTDARSLRALAALEKRGLVQCRSGRWYITAAGRQQLEQIESAGLA